MSGLLAAALALPKVVRAKILTPQERPLPVLDSEVYKPAICKSCPALCMLRIRVVNGKPVGVSEMSGHPVNDGTLCPKGNAILQELYHPDRLRFPLRQKGERGSNQWERISWDEACEILRAKLSDLLKRGKPEALGILAAPVRDIRHEIQKRFAQAFGTSHFWEWNWPLSEFPLEAFHLIHGSSKDIFYDLSNASLIVSFGWDRLQAFGSPVEAQRAYGELRRGKPDRRARILQIEPRLSVTAGKADEWIAIKPDTEGILALGIAQVLIRDHLYDKNFVDEWTTGFEDFKTFVLKEYSPETVSRITGAKTSQLLQVAKDLALIKPALAITYRGSLFNQLAVHTLNLLVGAVGKRGGVLFTDVSNYELVLPPLSVAGVEPRPILPYTRLPEAILNSSSSPIEVFWMERVNPVFLSPGPHQWKKALARMPFIVSFSSFLDESSTLAGLVLPPHHSLEAWQYGFSRTIDGRGVTSFAPPVIPPFDDTGDHGDFLLRLARSLGGNVARALPWEDFVASLQEALKKMRTEEPMKKGEWWEYEGMKEDMSSLVKNEFGKLKSPVDELKEETAKHREFQSKESLQLYVYGCIAEWH